MSVLGVVGAVVGFYFGGPSGAAMGYSLGSGVDSVVNAPDRVGPRLEDLRVQLSQYGATVPFEWGANRHAGTIIWPRILEAVENRQEESAKGGPDNVSFTYSLSCAVLICEGPIAGVRRIWANKKIVYDVSIENEGETRDPAIRGVRIHLGTEEQVMDPLIEATDGAGPAYRGYAYVVFEDYDVTDLGGRPPQWEFEVITSGNADIDPPTTFGERYLGGVGAAKFEADIDQNGHIWLHTMAGHAWTNPETGTLEVNEIAPSRPQIQEYDSATGELLWYYDVPPVAEVDVDGETTSYVYPIRGTGACSGGYYFIGRGQAGSTPNDGPYVHGMAVNIITREVTTFIDQCSSQQFQNSFYWPSVPIPVINKNHIYFSSGNGLETRLGVGFMPASIPRGAGGAEDIDPVPDRSGATPLWSAPAGWHQARAKGSCPTTSPKEFDGTGLFLPDHAYKSTVIRNPDAVLVQGDADNGTYLAFIGHSPIVTSFDLAPPSAVLTCVIPGDGGGVPCIAWDPINATIWAFGGPAGGRGILYAITPSGDAIDASGSGGLRATLTGFSLPPVQGQSEGNDVKGMAYDEATGHLRLLVGGFYSDVRLMLLDPVGQRIIEEQKLETNLSATTGRLWNLPDQNKTIYTDGFYMYDLAYAPSLAPNGIPLSTIVADICRRAGLASEDIDVSDLTDLVDGYVVPRQMTARAAIEPLQQAFFFDAVESDDKVKFVKRGKSAATYIPIEDRAAHELGEELPDALTVTRAFELELPVQCDVEYPDIEADHLIGNQSDRRITKDTRHNINLQLPIVMTAAKAKAVARTLLYEAWQNQSFRFKTTRKYARLEPTDLVELPTGAALYRGRITAKREQPNGIIDWEARVDSVSVYTQTGEGAVPITYPPQSIFFPTLTQLALLDIPLLRDEDDGAGFYVAMGAL